MTVYHEDPWLTIHEGDCREVMSTMPAASVQTIITSPPYWGLRDYGHGDQLGLEKTPEEYVANMVSVFREARRVLRDDGTLWLNLGDTFLSSGGQRTYGSSDGGTGRGPGTRRHDVAAAGLKPKDLVGIPWRVALAMQADGWYLRSDIIWAKPNPMPESITDRPTKAHEYLFLLTKSPRYYYDADSIREPHTESTLARVEYGLKHRHPADVGVGIPPVDVERMGERFANPAGRNARTVWTIATQPYPGAHFATMPEALVEPCVKAGSKTGDIVLDPFGGSGTVAQVANRLNRRAVLIDLNPEYIEQQMKRASDIPLGLA